MAMLHTRPVADGFAMPAEFAPHRATVLIWPVRPGSWGRDPSAAQKAFLDAIAEIAKGEEVYLLAGAADFAVAKAAVADIARVTVFQIESNDAWARDVGPTFVTRGKELRGISWRFNAWGGEVDGLYAQWDKDDAVAPALCKALGVDCYDAGDFVLEGGSIHVDGEGTLLTTEACLLSAGRNPSLSREQIEATLAEYLDIRKVLWLPRGIYQDETNEHVDNMVAFARPGELFLAWSDDPDDPQYEYSHEALAILKEATDAKGRHFKIHFLRVPSPALKMSEAEARGLKKENSTLDVREGGRRLAASYVNFIQGPEYAIIPAFGVKEDRIALEEFEKAFPEKRVIQIPTREILLGGGNIHCLTMQMGSIEEKKDQ